MKLKGQKAAPPKPLKVEFFREDEQGNPANITFLCGAVLDLNESFERYCPEPKPPLVSDLKSGQQYHDESDKKYLAKRTAWGTRRISFLVIRSLLSTPELEWENVKVEVPDTWDKYREELNEFLTPVEITRLVNAVLEANNPSENRRKEALENFSSTPQQTQKATSSPEDEAISTLSSEPANA